LFIYGRIKDTAGINYEPLASNRGSVNTAGVVNHTFSDYAQ